MANDPPVTTSAGQTSHVCRHEHMQRTIQNGTMNEKNGDCRPAIALSVSAGSPVTVARVKIGVLSPPNATGEVLAIKHSTAARSGLKPSPARIAPQMATGDPAPAAPSRNAPNANATRMACTRASGLKPDTDRRTIANWPVTTVTL